LINVIASDAEVFWVSGERGSALRIMVRLSVFLEPGATGQSQGFALSQRVIRWVSFRQLLVFFAFLVRS
jgi:hypothetical protein